MPQQIYIPNRDATLEYPDDATDEQIKADIDSLYPRNGEDVFKDTQRYNAIDYRPSYQDFLKLEAYQAELGKDDQRGIVEKGFDAVSAFGKGLKHMLVDDIGGAVVAGGKLAANGEFQKVVNSLIEGSAQGMAFPAMLAYSENTQSPLFKLKSFITGTGTPQERYEQFLNARDMQSAMKMAESGEMPMIRELKDFGGVDPKVAKGASYVLDGFAVGMAASKLVGGAARAGMTGAELLEQTSKQMAAEAKTAGMAKTVFETTETAARATSYLADWQRGAQAYTDAVLTGAREEAGKLIDINPAKAQQLLEEATQHTQDVLNTAKKAGNWMGNLERAAGTYVLLNAALGSVGGLAPLAVSATARLGEGFAKAAEFFSGIAKEAADIAAQRGGGQVSALESVASQGSTYGRRKVAEAAAKYGIPIGETLKGAAQGAIAGSIIGGAIGYGMEGTLEGAAEAAGGGAGFGAVAGTVAGAKSQITGEAYKQRVLKDFARDYNERPNTITVDFLKQTEVLDRSGEVVGVSDSFILVEVNDKAARAKAVERFSGKELSRILSLTKTAEESGAKVVFHDDKFSMPDNQGTKYNGVTIFTGADGNPTILLNVDRMKASTASHEVFHALVGDEFAKQMREQLFGDITKFDPDKFAASEQGAQFRSFVETYGRRAPEGQRLIDTTFRALDDRNIAPADRAAMLARATEEFGAYYFENWAQNKHPDVFLRDKVPNVWESAFRNVTDNLFRELGTEQARAHGGVVDPITGHFYRDGKRIVIPEWDALASRFLDEHRNSTNRPPEGFRPVTEVPRPRVVSAVFGAPPETVIDVEGRRVVQGIQAPVPSDRYTAAEERMAGTTVPSGPPMTTGRLLEIADTAVTRSVDVVDAPTRTRLVQKVLDEMERTRREGGSNNPTIFIDAGGAGMVEAPNPYYKPGAKPKPTKPAKVTPTKTPAPAAVVEVATRDLPTAVRAPLPATKPKEKPTTAPTPVQSPLVPNDTLIKFTPPTVEAEIVSQTPIKSVEDASKVTQTPTLLRAIPDARKLEAVQALGFADEYGKNLKERQKIHNASDIEFRKIFGERILSTQDVTDKLTPNRFKEKQKQVGQSIVHVSHLSAEMLQELKTYTTPDGVQPFAGKGESLDLLAKSLNDGTPMRWSGYHEILNEKGQVVDWYHVTDRLVVPWGIEKLPDSGLRVRWLDLDQMRDNLNAYLNNPAYIKRTKDLGYTARSLGLSHAKMQQALGAYVANLNKGASKVPTAKLFGDMYFKGDEKRGAQFRDMLYLVRDIAPAKGIKFENNPPWDIGSARQAEAAMRKAIPGREEVRRPGGTSTISDGRLDRMEVINPAPEGEGFKVPYKYKAYNSMESNFQPADVLVESLGNGSVATDKRTGWRMVSKDGRSQKLYRPDGSLHGVYKSAEEAKLALNKLSICAMEFEASSAKTQIATTVNTYAKASDQLNSKGKTIDYGAGLGLGADVLREKGFNTDSYEPFPDRWKGKQEVTFTDSAEIPSSAYNNVTNFSVLNVVKPNVRSFIVSEIGRILAPKGKALITARTLQDVSAAKIKTPSTEPGGFIVGDRYQKGFSQKELREYVKSVLGDGFTVQDNPNLNGASIEITKH